MILGSFATSYVWTGQVFAGSGHWRSLQNLVLDAWDEYVVGAGLVVLFVIVPCSAVLVVPICWHLCILFLCGEALGTVGGPEGADAMVVEWLVPWVAKVVAGMAGWDQRWFHLWWQ